jgi:hypothetical protein
MPTYAGVRKRTRLHRVINTHDDCCRTRTFLRTTYSCRMYHLSRSGRRTPPVILVRLRTPSRIRKEICYDDARFVHPEFQMRRRRFLPARLRNQGRPALSGGRPRRRCTNVLPRGRSTAPTNRSSRYHRADRKRTDRNHIIIRGPHAPAGSAPGVSARGRLVVQARPTAYVCVCVEARENSQNVTARARGGQRRRRAGDRGWRELPVTYREPGLYRAR